jgi:nitrogenase-stabilizing/protective protein
MNPIFKQIEGFSAAEEFFDFLEITYEPSVVHVNRLHILKRFNQYLARSPIPDDLDEASAKATLKAHLNQAYEDFVESSAQREKVFKVFQDQEAKSISLDSMRASLGSGR